jgi:hypothetical protein
MAATCREDPGYGQRQRVVVDEELGGHRRGSGHGRRGEHGLQRDAHGKRRTREMAEKGDWMAELFVAGIDFLSRRERHARFCTRAHANAGATGHEWDFDHRWTQEWGVHCQ